MLQGLAEPNRLILAGSLSEACFVSDSQCGLWNTHSPQSEVEPGSATSCRIQGQEPEYVRKAICGL